MKHLIYSLTILASIQVHAASSSQEVKIDGNQSIISLQLEQTRPKQVVDQVIPYETTCYREEYIGTRTECHTVTHPNCSTSSEYRCHTTYERECSGGGQTCYDKRDCQIINNERVCETVTVCNDSGPSCSDVPRESCGFETVEHCSPYTTQECQQVPEYRTVGYTCTQYHTTYKTVQHVTRADLQIEVGNRPEDFIAAELITFKIENEVLLTSDFKQADGNPSQYLWIVDKSNLNATPKGETELQVTGTVKVWGLSLPSLYSSIENSISDLKIENEQLSFTLPTPKYPELFRLKVRVLRKTLFSSRRVTDIAVNLDKLQLAHGEGRSLVTIPLSDLNLDAASRKKGTYKFELVLGTSLKTDNVENKEVYRPKEVKGSVKAKLKAPK